MTLTVYLSGEIHTQWRNEIKKGAQQRGLDIVFTSPVTDHAASDAAGDHLGSETEQFWRDHKSSKVNAIRTKTLIENSDLVVVRFGINISSGMQPLMRVIARRWVSLTLPCMAKRLFTR